MRTAEESRKAAMELLTSAAEVGLEIIDSATKEFDAGWVYYYQTSRFIQTGDIQESLVGNAPLFVPRNGERPDFISYHRPASESVEAFLSCGDANAAANAEIILFGWGKGASKVSATQAIRDSSSLGLAAAKQAVDQCLYGRPVRVPTTDVDAARALVFKLDSLGLFAKITYGGPPG